MKDNNYRRSMYIRYADDFVYLLEGPKAEALVVKERIKIFLHDNIGLELNDDKTIITHITEGFHFLGAFIKMAQRVGFMMKNITKTGDRITMTPILAFLPSLNGMEWIILIVLGVLLFGRKLPDMGRSLGKGMREFKNSVSGDDKHDDVDLKAIATESDLDDATDTTREVREAKVSQ